MTAHRTLDDACRAVGILPPRRPPVPGRWTATPAEGKGPSNTAGRVTIDATGRGLAWNWITNERAAFGEGASDTAADPRAREAERRRMAAEARALAERHAEAAAIATAIVRACTPATHPYHAAKGFPDEQGLVIADPRAVIPRTPLGEAITYALPEGEGPFLVIPGRIGRDVVTVQIITPEGVKKNLYGARMGGAHLRIATGRETWVAEGIATALSVRAALRLLNRPATVLCAFAAANVARVAAAIPGSIIAADHDAPNPHLHGKGAGEFHAEASGRPWIMPPAPGDWNDHHQAHGLRAVALALREVKPG